MANEPIAATAVDFLNHITDTLDRCSGKWHWDAPFPVFDGVSGVARVRSLNTGRVYHIEFDACSCGHWHAYENGAVCERITSLLGGHVRDDSGVLREPSSCPP